MEKFTFKTTQEVTQDIILPKYFKIDDSRYYMIIDNSRLVEVTLFKSKLIDFMTTTIKEDLIRYYLANFQRNHDRIKEISDQDFKDVFVDAHVELLNIIT